MGSPILKPLSVAATTLKQREKRDFNSSRCSERKVCTHCCSGSPSALRKDTNGKGGGGGGVGGGGAGLGYTSASLRLI